MTQQKNQVEYKNTLNLPQTTLSMRANACVREIETQKFWDENNIYKKMTNKENKEKHFILHDGPPYLSSDKIHIGTALNKILKDILIKYKTQRGYYCPYVPGYDGHGLPIENAVVKNIKGGRNAISTYELRQKCREFANKNLIGQELNFKRLGVLANWEHPYLTYSKEYEAQQVRIFGDMYKKGYIEKGLKPVYWCPICETALAEAEVEYDDHTSYSIYVKFKFDETSTKKIYDKINNKNGKDIYAVIWTTTPWTIPSNMAICVNPYFVYTIFEYENNNYIVANDLLDKFIIDVEFDKNNIKILGNIEGKSLENLNAIHPLYDRESRLILGEHVTQDAGCGLVHTAPGHGLEDWEVSLKYNIDVFSPINSKGKWTNEVKDLEGVMYNEGNKIIIENLEKKGALLKKDSITHSYPHCWRCKKPVIYRATSQWFVKIDKFKERTLNEIKKVKWIPLSGENRITNMVQNRSDWCISRQRVWGVPICVFYCKDCNKVIVNDEIINHIANIFEKESSDVWVKYDTKDLLPKDFKCPDCKSENITKETDIMDVWFDSGISWDAVVNKRKEELGTIPVDMYLEGSDQHRGWFQSSLLTSVAVCGIAPFKSVLTHGFVMAQDGKKMSKSLGNYITPQDITKVYGADILRLWAASVDYRNDIKIGETIIKQLVEIFKKIRNTSRFLLGNIYDFNPKSDYVQYENLEPIDKFALSKVNTLIKNVTQSFEDYEFYKYFQYLQNFAANDLSAFYLDIVKDRLYTQGKKSISRRASQSVLYETLITLIKILVPIMPHQAEEIWQNMIETQKDGIESALLTKWPEINEKWDNKELEDEFEKILELRETITKTIEPLRFDKKIGSSLEVGVYINSNKNKQLLTKYISQLANIFIVSQVSIVDNKPENALNSYEDENYNIYITYASGKKCERCWKYRDLNDNNLCIDCFEAIK